MSDIIAEDRPLADGLDDRFDEVSGELYSFLELLRDEDWEYYLKERGYRQRILELLDYIDYGTDEDEEAEA
ncbi:MAG: hypothetical protein IJT02_08125 [Synergistaceae bacterium]|nr:hypothetical protein [Synergistaceae bacterium]